MSQQVRKYNNPPKNYADRSDLRRGQIETNFWISKYTDINLRFSSFLRMFEITHYSICIWSVKYCHFKERFLFHDQAYFFVVKYSYLIVYNVSFIIRSIFILLRL